MSALVTGPMTQLTFSWGEPEETSAAIIVPSKVNLGIAVPKPTAAAAQGTNSGVQPVTGPRMTADMPRRGRPEHISDLLLVVLDRYGINPDEFLAGLQ